METTIAECSRCGNERETLVMFARPAGHTWFTPSDSHFGPRTEHVCGDCIEDFEFSIILTPVVEFVLSGHIKTMARFDGENPRRDDWLRSLEMVKSLFTVFNLEHPRDNRPAALRALGFKDRSTEGEK